MFEKLNVPILGVVENMSHFICPNCDDKHYIFGEGGGLKISEQFKIPFLGEIPLNSGIMAGSDLGKPIMISSVDSPSAEAFRISAKNSQHNAVFKQQNYKKRWQQNLLKKPLKLLKVQLRTDFFEIT